MSAEAALGLVQRERQRWKFPRDERNYNYSTVRSTAGQKCEGGLYGVGSRVTFYVIAEALGAVVSEDHAGRSPSLH